MFKGKISLQAFAGAISQSVTKANEMLLAGHREAMIKALNDEQGLLAPPPLMIQNVKVRFKANVSRSDYERDSSDLLIDLSKPDGNFNGELEFVPFSSDMLRSAKPGDRPKPFPARPARPERQTAPQQFAHGTPTVTRGDEATHRAQDDMQPIYPAENMESTAYDNSDTPRNYSLDV